MMAKTRGKKTAKQIKKAAAKSGSFAPGELEAYYGEMADLAARNMETGRVGAGSRIRTALTKAGYDWQDRGGTIGAYTAAPGEEPAVTTTGSNVDSALLDALPDKWMQDLLTSKGGENLLTAMGLQDFITGRAKGVDVLQGALGDFMGSDIVQGLQSQIGGLLAEPDVLTDDDVSQMLGVASGQLAQSYQNQAAGLANALGGIGLGADSGISQELAQALRFGALQQEATQGIDLRTRAKQLNRASLENAIRMGVMGAGAIGGTQQQYATGIANLMAGQPLASITAPAAALAAANNAPVVGDEGGGFAGLLGGGLSGALAGSSLGPAGMFGGALLGGLGGYFG